MLSKIRGALGAFAWFEILAFCVIWGVSTLEAWHPRTRCVHDEHNTPHLVLDGPNSILHVHPNTWLALPRVARAITSGFTSGWLYAFEVPRAHALVCALYMLRRVCAPRATSVLMRRAHHATAALACVLLSVWARLALNQKLSLHERGVYVLHAYMYTLAPLAAMSMITV